MDSKEASWLVNKLILEQTGEPLSNLQDQIIRYSWQDYTYENMATDIGRSTKHIKDTGSKLWRILSKVLGKKVSKKNFHSLLQQEWQKRYPLGNPAFAKQRRINQRQDWGSASDVNIFFGRVKELEELRKSIVEDNCRLMAIVGMGGIGKTDLSLKLARVIQDEFDFVIWRSLLNAPPLTDILTDLIKFLSNQQETELSKSLDRQIFRLLHYLSLHRCLLILDNAESILQGSDSPDSPTQAGKYKKGFEGYGQMFERIGSNPHNSCLLLTSREKPHNLTVLAGKERPVRLYELGGVDYVSGMNIICQEISNVSGSEEQWQELIKFYKGNPLALQLVAKHIQSVFAGNIAEFLEVGHRLFYNINELLDWHFERLSVAQKEILYWLEINREPTTIRELREDILSPEAGANIPSTLELLQHRLPLEKTPAGLTLQPVLIEYLTECLIKQICAEIETGNLELFNSYALLKALAKDYVREAQVRLILKPIAARLIGTLGSQSKLETRLRELLTLLRGEDCPRVGYAAGNILNFLCCLGTDLRGYDFSHLMVQQAYLQGVNLPQVNFAHSNLAKSAFNQSFGGVHALAFSPDGKLLAVGDSNGQIHLRRVKDGQFILTLSRHQWWTASVAFSPDSKRLVSSSLGTTVKLWSTSTGECKDLKGHEDWVWTVAFSPNGQVIASASNDQTIRLWDGTTGECLRVLRGHESWVLAVAFSPNCQVIASGGDDNTIRLWDANTGECLKVLRGHEDSIWSVAFHRDGSMLVSAGLDKTVKLWNTSTGECLNTLQGHTKEIKVIACSPDGNTIASGCFEPTVRLWDANTGECLNTLQGHATGIRSLAFSPDSQTLASGDNDQVVRLWDTRTGDCLNIIRGYTNWVWSVAYSSDSRTIASGNVDHKVRLWDVNTEQLLNTLEGHTAWVWSVAFSPDGRTVASSGDDETIRLWDVSTGQCLNTWHYPTSEYQGGVWTIAFSPDGRFLASGGQDRTVKLWDISTRECYKILEGHKGWIWSVTFSPDGRILVSGSDDYTARLWDVSTGQYLKNLVGHTDTIRSVAFSPDGHILATSSEDQTIKLWNIDTGECLQTLQEHQGWVVSVMFGYDGQILASASHDHTIKLWDTSTGQCLETFQGHTAHVNSLAFDPDGRTLISGSTDETVKHWDVQTRECLNTIKPLKPYEGMNITNVTGLTEAQKANLKALGAVEHED